MLHLILLVCFHVLITGNMEQLCSEIQTTYKCKFNVDFENLEKEYSGEEDAQRLSSGLHFKATFKNGNEFKCELLFTIQEEPSLKQITIIMAENSSSQIKNLTVIYDLTINGRRRHGSSNGKKIKFVNPEQTKYGAVIDLSWLDDKMSTCKGTIEMEFKSSSSVSKKEE